MNYLITLTLILFTGFQPLKWSDFKAKPYTNDVALTASRIDISKMEENGCFTWNIEAVFDSDSSFTRTNDAKILIHEEGHWGITKAYAKIIQRFLEPYQKCSKLKSKSVEIVIKNYIIYWRKTQNKYDSETQHAQNQYYQNIWNKKIKYLYNE